MYYKPSNVNPGAMQTHFMNAEVSFKPKCRKRLQEAVS